MEKIDFVILWVDGNDEKWLKEKNKYKKEITGEDISNNVNRFRDWDLLRYWFRGVEKYALWVNKIHFVTYGHLPEWLDTTNPKLNIVKHEDFIPKEYLPTFNSNVIQYFLNRIDGITDRFVMFDDDQFILKNVKETDFFKGNKICDMYGETANFTSISGDVYPHCILNNMQCINKHYNKRKIYKKHLFKYINIKYGISNNIRTLLLTPWSYFVGIYSPHICQAYTKRHYDIFWKYCENELKENCNNKFRERSDLSTFLIRYIELLEGDFVPRNHKFGRRCNLGKENSKICKMIEKQKYSVLCINDSDITIDFEKTQKELKDSFETILPDKSTFEK